MQITALVGLLGGVARTGQLRALGVHPRAIADAVDHGLLVRVRRGCVALPDADAVDIATTAWQGVSTCITAARQLSLPVLSADQRIHLARPPWASTGGRHAVPPRHVHLHRGAGLTEGTPAIRAVAGAGRCLDAVPHLAMVDAALHRGLLSRDDIAGLSHLSATRRAWLLAQADARTQSPAETVTRVALRRARIPFAFQHDIATVGRVDFLLKERLIVEVDGKDYHSSPAAFLEDRRRDRAALELGLRTIRFTGGEAIYGSSALVAAAQRALASPLRPSLRAFGSK